MRGIRTWRRSDSSGSCVLRCGIELGHASRNAPRLVDDRPSRYLVIEKIANGDRRSFAVYTGVVRWRDGIVDELWEAQRSQ